MNKRAVTYARVSSDDRGKDGRNLSGQLEMCRDYALKKGYNIVAELAEDDSGVSGASFELAKLEKVLEMAKARNFDILVVRELDRLSRNLAKQLIVEEELKRSGIKIEYVLGEYEESPEGNLMKHVRAVVAEYERMKINERIQRGKRIKVRAGSVMLSTNRPPYGYRVVEDGHLWQLEIVEDEARVIRWMYDWYLYGDENGNTMTHNKIAQRLTSLKIPTPVDIRKQQGITLHKKRAVAEWTSSIIGHYLSSEVYKGKWTYGKKSSEPLSVEVPPIIDPDQWEKCQRLRKEKYIENKRGRKNDYLFARRIRCGLCTSVVVGTPVNGYLYYRCLALKKGKVIGVTCNAPHFRVEQVESAVWNWLVNLLKNPDALQAGLEDYQREAEKEINPFRERLRVIDELLKQNDRELGRILDLYLSDQFEKEMLITRKDEIEAAMSSLKKEQEKILEVINAKIYSPKQIENIHEFANKVRSGLGEAENSFKAKRSIVDMLDVHVILTVEGNEKVVYVQCALGEDHFAIGDKNKVTGNSSSGGIRNNTKSIYANCRHKNPRRWIPYQGEFVRARERHPRWS